MTSSGRVNFQMAVHLHDDLVSYHICKRGAYEVPSVQKWFSQGNLVRMPQHTGIMLDIGANVGWYSLMFAVSGWRVYAVEASPMNVALLNASLCHNSLDSEVTILNYALQSAEPNTSTECHMVSTPENVGNMQLCCGNDFPHHCSITNSRVHPNWSGKFLDRGGGVQLRTLDEALERQGRMPIRVNAVKMDIEGYECEALRGGLKALFGKKSRPIMFQVELYSEPPNGAGMKNCNASLFGEMLSSYGYTCKARRWAPKRDYSDNIYALTI
eukprot:CAMPEP_0119314190 /NCGR_PEP_ID=MMETSP1333-20130426/32017_1 /TAXON_ID=418940 /ORGANISM="Scyphosphaera apsteinii, Strain RCC1455" /LENGTH=269 /DNA_ID=CAMNT_0007319253 /DNA_START=346 /DNA_END=1155 /DNA_ORIENTATION=+